MNIVYASDDGYAACLSVSILSLMEHNESEELCFHILSDGISEEHRRMLREEIEDEGKSVIFYELSDLSGELSERVPGMDTGRFRTTTLARLLMGSILPETVTKALYLDADTVILQSIHDLPHKARTKGGGDGAGAKHLPGAQGFSGALSGRALLQCGGASPEPCSLEGGGLRGAVLFLLPFDAGEASF